MGERLCNEHKSSVLKIYYKTLVSVKRNVNSEDGKGELLQKRLTNINHNFCLLLNILFYILEQFTSINIFI